MFVKGVGKTWVVVVGSGMVNECGKICYMSRTVLVAMLTERRAT